MEWIESLEHKIFVGISLLKLLLEVLAALFILLGLLRTIRVWIKTSQRSHLRPTNELRIVFGTWLSLALEFQLGADILETSISPSLESLRQLAIIAVIRTFLNYFLSKELEDEHRAEKHLRNQTVSIPSEKP